MPISLAHTLGTDIFRGEGDASEQGVRVTVTGAAPGARVAVRLDGGPAAAAAADEEGRAVLLAFVPQPSEPSTPGRPVTLSIESGGEAIELREDLPYGEPGWTMHLAPHFHFDPVWWNTQAAFISEWETLPVATEARMFAAQMTAFDLMREHLDRARTDPDYCFVVAELDYLKPWWDSFPEERTFLRQLIRDGRVEATGGSYNEPSTTLISAESTIRNAISGLGFQRTVLGADPTIAWQLDVFGHDPHYPGLMSAAGLTRSSWARGPFHEWGPMSDPLSASITAIQDVDPGMQFDQEFEWMSPSGRGLLTSYQAAHYHAGWWMDSAETLEDAEWQVYDLFRHLKTASATRHVLLLVGTDHVRPNRWVTDIHRHWAEQFTWPRFLVGTPSDYFEALETEVAAGRGTVTTQTRDMNPVFGGTAVSFIDTKQAARAAETGLVRAEKFATLARIRGLGTQSADAAIDHAWRQLAFASHHDAITGSESDQVYIDLLGLWRGAWSTARTVEAEAIADILVPRELAGEADSVTVFNAISADRTDVVRATVARRPGPVRDADGIVVPSVVTGSDESGWAVDFIAAVPATGYATFTIDRDPDGETASGWADIAGTTIANERYALTVDPARGGTVSSLRDLASGAEILAEGGAGNEIVVYDEYPDHPVFRGLGPWHINPTGKPPVRSSAAVLDSAVAQRSAAGERVVVDGRLDGMRFRQTLTLWAGVGRVDAVTRFDFAGADQLVRIAWPCRVPGAVPVAQLAGAVIGRGISHPDADSQRHMWVMDSTCHEWFGLSAPVRIRVTDPDGAVVSERAVAVAEIVSRDLDESAELGRELARALVRCGVTSTNSLATGPRYGDLDKDSNQPDLRIALGTAETNPFIAAVLAASDPAVAAELRRGGDRAGALLVPARPAHDLLAPGATVVGILDLPVLILTGDVPAAVAGIVADLGDAIVELRQDAAGLPRETVADRSVALVNRGTPGYAVDRDGTLYLSALRSSTGWPSGVWINPPTRTTPDGAAFQLQHWTHAIEYAIVAGAGDWRDAGFAELGQGFNQPFTAVVGRGTPGGDGSRASLLRVDPPSAHVSVVKPAGYHFAFPGGAEGEGIALRVVESLGRPTVASVSFGGPMVADARLTDLPEFTVGASVVGGGDRIEVPVAGFDIETVRVRFAGSGSGAGAGAGARASVAPQAPAGPPAFSRYWLHNSGPAPVGNQPVSVRILDVGRSSDGGLEFDIQLATELANHGISGRLRVEATGAGRVRGTGQAEIRSAEETHRERVVVDLGAADLGGTDLGGTGTTVIATFDGPSGPAVYDAVAIGATGLRLPAIDISDAISTTWTRDAVEVAPGHRTELELEIRNSGSFELRGEVSLLSPWGTWTWIDDWARTIEVPAGESTAVAFTVAPPPGTDASTTWALAKIGALGAVSYSATVPLLVRDD